MYTTLRYYFISLQKTVPNEILRVQCATKRSDTILNPLKVELNPICYLLAFLAHHFLHVKSLNLRLLMSHTYIYIYIYIYDISNLRVKEMRKS